MLNFSKDLLYIASHNVLKYIIVFSMTKSKNGIKSYLYLTCHFPRVQHGCMHNRHRNNECAYFKWYTKFIPRVIVMPKHCEAFGCTNHNLKAGTKILYHVFPRDAERKKRWIQAANGRTLMAANGSLPNTLCRAGSILLLVSIPETLFNKTCTTNLCIYHY